MATLRLRTFGIRQCVLVLMTLVLGACQSVPTASTTDRPLAGFYRIRDISQNTKSCSSLGPREEARVGRLVRLASPPQADALVGLLECDSNCKCQSLRIAGYRSRHYGGFVIYKNRNVCTVTLSDYWIDVKPDTVVLERRNYQKVMVDAACDIDVERETFRKQDTPCISRETIVLVPAPAGTCPMTQ